MRHPPKVQMCIHICAFVGAIRSFLMVQMKPHFAETVQVIAGYKFVRLLTPDMVSKNLQTLYLLSIAQLWHWSLTFGGTNETSFCRSCAIDCRV